MKDRCAAGGDAAYVTDGAIRRTELRSRGDLLSLGVLALDGAPAKFVAVHGEIDVEGRRAGGARAWAHTFKADDRRAVGLRDDHEAEHRTFTAMPRDAVEHVSAGAVHVVERDVGGVGGG